MPQTPVTHTIGPMLARYWSTSALPNQHYEMTGLLEFSLSVLVIVLAAPSIFQV